MAEHIPGQDARQGKQGKPVLYVLIASLILLAVAITGLMTWQGKNSPPDYAGKSQDASRQTVTGSKSGSTSESAPSSTGSVPAANPPPSAPR